MRCFIGLDIHAKQKLALQSWCKNALPEVRERESARKSTGDKNTRISTIPAAVPPANYHVTLCFLGSISQRQHELLVQGLSAIRSQPFSLQFTHSGFWAGPKIIVVEPQVIPTALIKLEKQVRKAAREAGIQIEARDYRPHITLVRKASAVLPPPLSSPEIHCDFSEFQLFESLSGAHGVTYPVRESWPLLGELSMREQLRQGLI